MLKVWVVGSSPTMESGQMTALLPLACKVFVDELVISGCAEAREVAAVDDGHGQSAEAFHRCRIIFAVGMIGIVDQRTVVDDVAGEEYAAGFFEEANAARGMAGGVDDLEMPVTEINDLAVGQQALGRSRLYLVARCVPTFWQAVEHVVGGVAVSQRPVVARVC